MNQRDRQRVERIKSRISERENRTPFKYTKVGRIITRDPIDLLFDYLGNYIYLKECEKKRQALVLEGYKGKADDYEAIVRYEEAIGSRPIQSIQDEDGVWIHTYPDGNQVRVKVTLSSIFPSSEVEDMCMKYIREQEQIKMEEEEKLLYSSYTGISYEVIKSMSWEEINEAILNSSKKPISRMKRVLIPKKNIRENK